MKVLPPRSALASSIIAGLTLAAIATPVAAGNDPTPNPGDTAWMLTSTLLVLMMSIPGLALFYGGLVRTKNMLSILSQTFAIVSLVGVIWAVYGYSFAFGDGGAVFFADADVDGGSCGFAASGFTGGFGHGIFLPC